MVDIAANERILGMGIVGPLSVEQGVIRCAIVSTLNEGSSDYYQRNWSLDYRKHTVALSYRYGWHGRQFESSDADNAVDLIMEHCSEQSLNSIYIWLDRAYASQRTQVGLDWAAGGIAPYANFKVISVVSSRASRIGDSYWRFWIWMETVLGAAGKGLCILPRNANQSHALDNLFNEFRERGKQAVLGMQITEVYILSGFAAALCQNLLDDNPLWNADDRRDLKRWAVSIRNKDINSHLRLRKQEDISIVVSLFGGAPMDPFSNSEDIPCWDISRDFEFEAPNELMPYIENGVAIICKKFRFYFAVCIPKYVKPGIPATSILSVSIEDFDVRSRTGEASWRRRMVTSWQLAVVTELQRYLRVRDMQPQWQLPAVSAVKQHLRKGSVLPVCALLALLDPRYERESSGDDNCEIVEICKISDLDITNPN